MAEKLPGYTGLPSNAQLTDLIYSTEMELANHSKEYIEYEYPVLRILFIRAYAFLATFEPENSWRKAFLSRFAEIGIVPREYSSTNPPEDLPLNHPEFPEKMRYKIADEIYFSIQEFLNASGLIGYREKPQDKIEWSWDEIRETDRKMR